MRQFCLCVLFLICATSGALAQEGRLSYLGSGRLFVNDMIGDGDDRWRTGSISVSHVFGPSWRGQLPERPGEIIEVRVMGEVIAPYRLNRRNAGDRPFAGSWSLGAHSHFQRGGWQMSLGADAVITGPQTGLANLQQFLHRTVGFDHKASPSVLAGQIPNGIHAAGVFETGRDYAVGRATLRPFVEARAGVEDLARVGFDLTFGSVGRRELMIRDTVTGIRYRSQRKGSFPRSGGRCGKGLAQHLSAVRAQSNHRSTLSRPRGPALAGQPVASVLWPDMAGA